MKIVKIVPVMIETAGADDQQCSVHCAFHKGDTCSRYGEVIMGFRGDTFVLMARCDKCLREFGVSAEIEPCSE